MSTEATEDVPLTQDQSDTTKDNDPFNIDGADPFGDTFNFDDATIPGSPDDTATVENFFADPQNDDDDEDNAFDTGTAADEAVTMIASAFRGHRARQELAQRLAQEDENDEDYNYEEKDEEVEDR